MVAEQCGETDLPGKVSLIGAVVFTLKENHMSSLKNNILIAKSKIGEKIVARSNFELLNIQNFHFSQLTIKFHPFLEIKVFLNFHPAWHHIYLIC